MQCEYGSGSEFVLPNAYIQKFDSKNGTFSEIDLKFDELEKIYQSLTFLVNYVASFQLK